MGDHTYIPIVQCQRYWEQEAIPVPWPDVHLPKSWHLNQERVPMPADLASGHAQALEIRRRRDLLPEDLVHDSTVIEDSPYWDT